MQSTGSRVRVTQPVGSSKGRDRTHVSCVGRQILNHWTPRKDHCGVSARALLRPHGGRGDTGWAGPAYPRPLLAPGGHSKFSDIHGKPYLLMPQVDSSHRHSIRSPSGFRVPQGRSSSSLSQAPTEVLTRNMNSTSIFCNLSSSSIPAM